MRKSSTLTLTILLIVVGCKKPAAAIVPQEFSPEGGRFTVMMPGTPNKQERFEAGFRLIAHGVESPNDAHMVGYSDIPASEGHELDGALDGMRQKASGTITYSTGGSQVINGKMTVWREFEMTVTTPRAGYAAGRVIYARGRLYIVMVMGSDNRLAKPETRAFIDSFRLTDGDTPGVGVQPGTEETPATPKLPVTPKLTPKPPVTPNIPKNPVVIKPPVTPPDVKLPITPPQPKKPQAIGNPFDPEFTEMAPEKGVLVGFDVGMSTFVNREVVGTLRPVFRVGRQEMFGEIHGTESKRTVNVVAKDGYAVGAISVKPGIGIDGFSLTFMKIAGDKLDPNDSYTSDWIGYKGVGKPTTQDGGGKPVVGIIGKVTKMTSKNATGIGLIFKE